MVARRGAGDGPIRVGVISDTHGRMPDEVLEVFEGVEAIVHAGDSDGGYDLDLLPHVAPTYAVRGNCDNSGEAGALPRVLNVAIGDVRFLVAHKRRDLPGAGIASARVVVAGHTHRAEVREEHGKLFVNPGSAGDPRQGDPASVAIVEIDGTRVTARIVELGDGP